MKQPGDRNKNIRDAVWFSINRELDPRILADAVNGQYDPLLPENEVGRIIARALHKANKPQGNTPRTDTRPLPDAKEFTCRAVKENGADKLVGFIDSLNIDYFGETEKPADCYVSMFYFQKEFQSYYGKNGRKIAGYEGPLCCRDMLFDVDAEYDIEGARQSAVMLFEKLLRHGFNARDIRIYFSGCKGFHLTAHLSNPYAAWDTVAIKAAHLKIARGIEHVDTGIYDRLRFIRIPNSQHAKTGLYKIPLTLTELSGLSITEIKNIAQGQRKS